MTLQDLKKLAREKAVWFSVEYSECEDTWYGDVSSAAPTERKGWKRYRNLDELLELMAAWMESL